MVPEKIPRVRVRQQELGWFVNLPVGWSQSRVDLVANCRGRAMARKRGYRPPQPSWSLAAGVWRLPGVVAAVSTTTRGRGGCGDSEGQRSEEAPNRYGEHEMGDGPPHILAR